MPDAREVIAEVLEFKFQADTIIAALTAAGLVIVPKEPTEEMYRHYYATEIMAGTRVRDQFTKRYRAMVEAASNE